MKNNQPTVVLVSLKEYREAQGFSMEELEKLSASVELEGNLQRCYTMHSKYARKEKYYEKNYGTVELPDWDSVNSDLPIKVEITTTTRDDGMIEKTATYYMRGGVNMSGDWVVNIYDYATGLDLEAKGYEAFGSETTRSEDGKTVIWSVTIVHDKTVDPVFLWTQVTNNFEMCYRTNITNDEEYFNATERVLDNFTDLLSFEGGYWFLATK